MRRDALQCVSTCSLKMHALKQNKFVNNLVSNEITEYIRQNNLY